MGANLTQGSRESSRKNVSESMFEGSSRRKGGKQGELFDSDFTKLAIRGGGSGRNGVEQPEDRPQYREGKNERKQGDFLPPFHTGLLCAFDAGKLRKFAGKWFPVKEEGGFRSKTGVN